MIQLGLNQPAAHGQSDLPAAESLQFRTAETQVTAAAPACSMCRQPVGAEYYHVAGAVTCSACAQARLADQQRRGAWPEFGRAALFGLGAAIAGSILFAIVSYATHMTFSLLAIVVGVMVGKAVLHGSRGLRGKRYQILAVLLTYASITTSYVPEIITGISQVRANAKKAGSPAKSAPPSPTRSQKNLTGAQMIFGLIFVVVLALIAPLLMLTSVSGLINLVIIGLGLLQAWRRTKADVAPIMGPYTASAAA